MADKNTLKNWFLTGLKPTQAQFWAWMDSYWHKDEKIPITAIDAIETILDEKADAEALQNHVSDIVAHAGLFGAKEDKSQKGIAGGYAPLDGFSKIAAEYLNIVNDLFSGGATALLSAEQGVVLQGQIENINILLGSDNVNLDNVQELVDAIEALQASLDTILVNDLTTGGTTKALTAEMGKSLKGLLDALTTVVAGKQDIANQIEVFSSQNADPSWHGKTVFFMANVTITIPGTGLPAGYTFEGVTAPSCSVSWAITAPKVWVLGAPAATPEKSIFTLMQLMSNSNNIYLFGL